MPRPPKAKAPISSVWKGETQHRHIWQSHGNCTSGCGRARDLICRHCGEAFCAKCLKDHDPIHLREKHIERVARGVVQAGVPAEEWAEAMALRATWEAEGAQAEEK